MPDPRPTPRPAMRRGARVAPVADPDEVTRRLASLERQVEDALASAGQASPLLPPIDSLLDGALGAYNRLWRAVAGEPEAAADLLRASLDLLYRWWWRVDVVGIERLPRTGPVLALANRAPTLFPFEAFMLMRALAPRPARVLVDDWLLRLPFVGPPLAAIGAVSPAAASARRVLAAGEVAIAFPEGSRAVAKPPHQRYRVDAFTAEGLLRAARGTGAAIVPLAVIGAEEVQPVWWRAERLGGLLGLPAVPITPALLPLPTKWTIHVGEPLDLPAGGARDRRALRSLGARARERLQGLLSDGLRRRQGLFF